ncbi:MAG: gliding motility protein GldC [Chitinophagaceae bacterium]|nr:MAG: gliding motility protein GldC [Chitinophagaceae bacterium]
MHKSTITIDVTLDDSRVPEHIEWKATESTASVPQAAKAMILALWDSSDKSALRIDLWTQKMMVDEMADFYYQTLMTMADTYGRATQNQEMVNEMKEFAKGFYKKFQDQQLKENKAG